MGRQSDVRFVSCSKLPVAGVIFLLGFLLPAAPPEIALVLSSLKAWRGCSGVKTGSLQCCNLMVHAASDRKTFLWPLHSTLYPTELPGQVESRVKTSPSLCAVLNRVTIFVFTPPFMPPSQSVLALYSILFWQGSTLNSSYAPQVLWSADCNRMPLSCYCYLP